MSSTRLVYSTEGGRTCPQCRQAQADCRCAATQAQQLRGDGRVRVGRESAGRGGKTVTVVRGLALNDAQITDLGKHGVIEIQGDHVERVLGLLLKAGHAAKRTGG
jgi:translation initiation factor 1